MVFLLAARFTQHCICNPLEMTKGINSSLQRLLFEAWRQACYKFGIRIEIISLDFLSTRVDGSTQFVLWVRIPHPSSSLLSTLFYFWFRTSLVFFNDYYLLMLFLPVIDALSRIKIEYTDILLLRSNHTPLPLCCTWYRTADIGILWTRGLYWACHWFLLSL